MNTNDSKDLPIGVLDSGLGGISVLIEAVKILPKEDFIYFGDSKNTPYGTKSKEEIKSLTFRAVEILVQEGIKALVVACNTATGVAIRELREKYKDLIIIGIEPAIKPAATQFEGGKIVAIATPMTIKQEKFISLLSKYDKMAEIKAVGCPGLMEFVEEGEFKQETLDRYFDIYLRPNLWKDTDVIVLGCTHYSFLKKQLETYLSRLSPQTVLMDGSYGTSMELKRRLREWNLLKDVNTNAVQEKGKIRIMNSSSDEKYRILGEKLLNCEI